MATPLITDAIDTDDAELLMQTLRQRGSGLNIRKGLTTTGRMTRILKLFGLTPSMHGEWCGYGLKEWIRLNPTWTEAMWVRLVAENYDRIKEFEQSPTVVSVAASAAVGVAIGVAAS